MMSGVFQKWLKEWDIQHQPSRAYFPHSNSRAETAVKSSKRMPQDCITKSGDTDNDKFMKAVLQYCNTPHQDCRKSPAQKVFGRNLRDHVPCLPYKYTASADWCITQELRERMLAKSREVDGENLARNTKKLPDIPVGTAVAVQNQTGRKPTKWRSNLMNN